MTEEPNPDPGDLFCHDHQEVQGPIGKPGGSAEIDTLSCEFYVARAGALYHRRDPECEADYRAAFFLDAELAASEMVQRLEDEILVDVMYVLTNSRKRLRFDPQDVIARIRLGLTLFLLNQDAEAFSELQQAFLQSPPWRPFLRLLVNQAKPRRLHILTRILGRVMEPDRPANAALGGSANGHPHTHPRNTWSMPISREFR
jgi:hypothetical protein